MVKKGKSKDFYEQTLNDVVIEVDKSRGPNKTRYAAFGAAGAMKTKTGKPTQAGVFGKLRLKDLAPQLVERLGDIALHDIKLMDFIEYDTSVDPPIRVFDVLDDVIEQSDPEVGVKFRQQVRYLLGNFASELNPVKYNNVIPLLPTTKADHLATQKFFNNRRSVINVVEAGLAIIDEPDRIAQFFDGLELYKDKNAHAAPVVDAIRVNALTGFRPSVITNLMENEIIEHSDGTISLKLQKDKKGMKSDTEEGGKFKSRKGQAIKVFVIPLDPYATQIVKDRLAILKEDRLNNGVKNPEGFLFYNVDPNTKKATAVETGSTKKFIGMNDVLGEIKVEGGILENQRVWLDNNTAERHDTLYVKGLGKSGAELLRNINTHIRIESGMNAHDVDVAQARPVSSRAEAAIVEKLSYFRQYSEKKNTDLMNRISGPIVNYFRNVVYQGKKDLITLNQSLEEIAQNAADQAKKIQTAVLDKLSLKSVEDIQDTLAKKDVVREQINKDFPMLDEGDRASFANVFKDITEYDTFRKRPYVEKAIKDKTVQNLLDVYTDPNQTSNIPVEERSLYARYISDQRTTARDVNVRAAELQKGKTEAERVQAQQQETDALSKKFAPSEDYDPKESLGSKAYRSLKKARKLPIIGAALSPIVLAMEAKAESDLRTGESAGELSISELDESIARQAENLRSAAQSVVLPATERDITDLSLKQQAFNLLRETPQYKQFKEEERGIEDSRRYDREMGLLGRRNVLAEEREKAARQDQVLGELQRNIEKKIQPRFKRELR
jgi:hypothetical protein